VLQKKLRERTKYIEKVKIIKTARQPTNKKKNSEEKRRNYSKNGNKGPL
jgi:hypothetical protein